MYQIVRDSVAVPLALSSGLRNARTQTWESTVTKAPRWNEVSFAQATRRSSIPRRIARSLFAMTTPIARPIAWRTRTFMTAPMHAQMSRLFGRIESQSTLLSAQLHQTESLIVSMSESLQRMSIELDEVRAEVARLREDGQKDG